MMPVFLTVLGIILSFVIIIWGLLGMVKPSWANLSTRKEVAIKHFGLGLLVLILSIIFSSDPLDTDQGADALIYSNGSSNKEVNIKSHSLREDFNVNKVIFQNKFIVDQYLGEPNKCEEFTDSLFCRYEWLGVEVYFDRAKGVSRVINVTKLPSLKFQATAIQKVGLEGAGKPDFSNEFVIKWDYFDGKEISVTSDADNTNAVSGIHIRDVPLTINYTASAGLPMSAVVAFALEHFYEELQSRNHNDVAILNLYMDGLTGEYGNKSNLRLVHVFKLNAQEVKSLRLYQTKNLFHSKRNKFNVMLHEELVGLPLAERFWTNR